MRVESEMHLILSGIQDVLIQAAQADGFAPSCAFNWAFIKNNVNAAFEASKESASADVYELSNQDFGQYAYETVLFKEDLKGQLECDSGHIFVVYAIKDSYKGVDISAKLRCYLRHPESYKQALIDAGAITTQTSTYETVQCGV